MKCEETDIIEIVCTYRYPITLTLKNNKQFSGVANDIIYNDKRQECLEILSEEKKKWIILDEISNLTVNQKNPHLQFIKFT